MKGGSDSKIKVVTICELQNRLFDLVQLKRRVASQLESSIAWRTEELERVSTKESASHEFKFGTNWIKGSDSISGRLQLATL